MTTPLDRPSPATLSAPRHLAQLAALRGRRPPRQRDARGTGALRRPADDLGPPEEARRCARRAPVRAARQAPRADRRGAALLQATDEVSAALARCEEALCAAPERPGRCVRGGSARSHSGACRPGSMVRCPTSRDPVLSHRAVGRDGPGLGGCRPALLRVIENPGLEINRGGCDGPRADGKRAIVTGGSRGIGKAIARAAGARRRRRRDRRARRRRARRQRARELGDETGAHGRAVVADTTDDDAVERDGRRGRRRARRRHRHPGQLRGASRAARRAPPEAGRDHRRRLLRPR